MKHIAISLAVLLILAILPVAPAQAAELGGVELADTATVGDQTLVLNGLGLRKKAIFKVYVGGLYLPKKSSRRRAPSWPPTSPATW